MEWINAKEELPTESKTYLVLIEGKSHRITLWTDHWIFFADKQITHWMPLPEAPEDWMPLPKPVSQ